MSRHSYTDFVLSNFDRLSTVWHSVNEQAGVIKQIVALADGQESKVRHEKSELELRQALEKIDEARKLMISAFGRLA